MLPSRSASPSAEPSPPRRTGLRVSQRPPTACRECAQRKVRCDKQTPCGRCVRLARPCTREVVRISKALSQHRDELRFLRALRARLLAAGPDGPGGGGGPRPDACAEIDARIRLLEHGRPSSSASETETEGPGYADGGPASSPTSAATAPPTPVPIPPPGPPSAGPSDASGGTQERNAKASILAGFEFLAWGRHSQTCFPHRRCRCYQSRRYAELVSINSDRSWAGRQALTPRAVAVDDLDRLLPPDAARALLQFHLAHLRWHHNAFHEPTFVAQCRQFWATGTVDHPLWLALYFAVCSVSLWTLLNQERGHLEAGVDRPLGDALADALGDALDESLVERLFQGMVSTLYAENFVENVSLYAVQAIVISTRIAHNLDRSDLNAILVGAAVRIAHCLGLHKIADPPDPGWHERVELETGKRVWLQLVIQDHFQIPFTDTYVIHPSQYITPLPINCGDYDMVEQPPDVATTSSYVRMLGRTAALIPPLLDGLGPMGARKAAADAYPHILACDRVMRANVAQIPDFLLRDDPAAAAAGTGTAGRHAAAAGTGTAGRHAADAVWLPLARRTLAISAAEKIIMIHRPVLFDSFQSAALRPTRATCVAAATTILREHEQAVAEGALAIWTHSAFCVTAAVVLGLELFHRPDHTDATAHAHRQMLARAAHRLRRRRCDAIAQRGALLIDTMLAAEEDLVLRMMRTARTLLPGAGAGAGSGPGPADDDADDEEAHQRAIINDMIGSHEIMARFLAVAPSKPDVAASTPLGSAVDPATPALLAGPADAALGPFAPGMAVDTGQDFDAWFNNVFAPVYNPMF